MKIDPAFGIYIHWPFCAKKCPYCDFNSHVREHINQKKWLRAYINELRNYAKETSERIVTSVFFWWRNTVIDEPFSCRINIDRNPGTLVLF